MGQRRMFSNRIANSARFLQMPAESQVLYFHMILRADDDGIVESYPLMKLLGVASDNFKVLVAKGFIKILNEDQVIVITDWLEHNTIRADRKVDSIYKHLLVQKFPEIKLIAPRPRIDVIDNSKRLGGQSTVGISQVKLSQDKIREGKIVETTASIESFFKNPEKAEKLAEWLKTQYPQADIQDEIKKFTTYWTETEPDSGIPRWQMERVFSLSNRLQTWFNIASQNKKDFVVLDYSKKK